MSTGYYITALSLCFVGLLPAAAQAQAPAAPPDDSKAVALFVQMARAYQSLRSYTGVETADGGEAQGMPYRMTLAYARPAQVSLEVRRAGHTPAGKQHQHQQWASKLGDVVDRDNHRASGRPQQQP